MLDLAERPALQQSEQQFDWLTEQSGRKIRQNQRRQRAESQARLIVMDIRMQELAERNRDLQRGEQPLVSDAAGLENHIGWILDRYM
jgi:hypothetical protein